jgi:lambda repressor-like predicted transcriptional regulator
MKKTVLLLEATKQYGSLRKMSALLNLSPSVLAQVNSGARKPWPKLRVIIASALHMEQDQLFDSNGWPRDNTEKEAI